MTTSIEIKRVEKSNISSVDFDNLPFGSVYSDHMLTCDFVNDKWQSPKIEPFAPISLMPSAKIFHYGQSIFEGMKAYKDKDENIMLFRPEENWKRLNKSAKRLVIPEIPEDIFMEGLKALLKLDSDWI